MVNDLDVYETSLMIPLDPVEPWTGTIIGSEPNTTVEQMTSVALTSLCESHLVTSTTMPITLFPIPNQANLTWKQWLEVVSDLEGLHFNAGMAMMAKYSQYLFNL
jgi:hypothetical protein